VVGAGVAGVAVVSCLGARSWRLGRLADVGTVLAAITSAELPSTE
jgi:hypothetical protein